MGGLLQGDVLSDGLRYKTDDFIFGLETVRLRRATAVKVKVLVFLNSEILIGFLIKAVVGADGKTMVF
jgi:hypothetical protein